MRRQGIFWFCTLSCNEVPELPMLRNGELPPSIVWICGQKEAGESGGYLHYQFCVAFSKKASLARVKEVFGRSVHAELSRSEHAASYCCKEATRVDGPWEWGSRPIRRNAPTDWDSVWSAAIAGNYDSIPAQIRVAHYRSLRAINGDYASPQPLIRQVFVYWGLTGTGKSRRAWAESGLDAYCKDPRSKFWCGYESQKNVVIDEFRGKTQLILGNIDISHLLRWFDRYPVRVEVKGSSRVFCAERIWITSNLEPKYWYPDVDSATVDALMRRLNITEFS